MTYSTDLLDGLCGTTKTPRKMLWPSSKMQPQSQERSGQFTYTGMYVLSRSAVCTISISPLCVLIERVHTTSSSSSCTASEVLPPFHQWSPSHFQRHAEETGLPDGPVPPEGIPVPSAHSSRIPTSPSNAWCACPAGYTWATSHSCPVIQWVSVIVSSI